MVPSEPFTISNLPKTLGVRIHDDDDDSSRHSSSYQRDMMQVILPEVAHFLPVRDHTNTYRLKGVIEFPHEIDHELNHMSDNDACKYRDAVVSAVIKVASGIALSTVCPLSVPIHFASAASKVQSDHFDPMSCLPSLEHEAFVERYIANSMLSATLDCGAVPIKLFNAVTKMIATNASAGLDVVGVTDKVIVDHYQASKSVILQAAENIHKKISNGSEKIQYLYDCWACDTPVHASKNLMLTQEDESLIKDLMTDYVKTIDKNLELITKASKKVKSSATGELTSTAQVPKISTNQKRLPAEDIQKQSLEAAMYAHSAGQAMSFLAFACGDRRAAQQFSMAGNASFQLISSAGMMSTNPILGTVGMLNGIQNLICACSDNDDGANPFHELAAFFSSLMHEAVRVLSERMKMHTMAIIGEIHLVGQMVGDSDASHMTEFFKLHATNNDIKQEIQKLHEKLRNRDQTQTVLQQGQLMQERHNEIRSLFASAPVDQIDKASIRCSRIFATEKSGTALMQALEEYVGFLTIDAQGPALTASDISTNNLERAAQALSAGMDSEIPEIAAYRNISLIIRLYEKILGCSFEPELKQNVSNPFIVAKSVSQLQSMIQNYTQNNPMIFKNQEEQEQCLRYFAIIDEHLNHSCKILGALFDPSIDEKIISNFHNATLTIRDNFDTFQKTQVFTELQKRMSDRLRSIAEQEIDTIQRGMNCPAFPEFEKQMTAINKIFQSLKNFANIPCGREEGCLNFIRAENSSRYKLPSISMLDLKVRYMAETSKSSAEQKEIIIQELEAMREDDRKGLQMALSGKELYFNQIRAHCVEKIRKKLAANLEALKNCNFDNLHTIDLDVAQSIIEPEDYDNNKLPLIVPFAKFSKFKDTFQNVCKLNLLMNEAQLKYTYAVEKNRLKIIARIVIDGVQKEIAYLWTAEHIKMLTTDEEIFNFWYGGRFGVDDKNFVRPSHGIWALENYFSDHWDKQTEEKYMLPVFHDGYIAMQKEFDDAPESVGFYKNSLALQQMVQRILIQQKNQGCQNFASMIGNRLTEFGQNCLNFNVLYGLLLNRSALFGRILEPHQSIVQTQNAICNTDQLRDCLLVNPEDTKNRLNLTINGCKRTRSFNGELTLLKMQRLLHENMKRLAFLCKQGEVKRAEPLVANHQLLLHMEKIEQENKRLTEQNEKMLALLTALTTKLGITQAGTV